MRLFHTTTADAAEAILLGGFRDGEGPYGFDIILHGVFLARTPANANDAVLGTTVLKVTLPDSMITGYAIEEEGREEVWEWCVPAAVINQQGQVRRLSDEEIDALVLGAIEQPERGLGCWEPPS